MMYAMEGMMKVEKLMKRDPIKELRGPKKGNARAKNQSKRTTGNRTSTLTRYGDWCTPQSFSHMKLRGIMYNPNATAWKRKMQHPYHHPSIRYLIWQKLAIISLAFLEWSCKLCDTGGWLSCSIHRVQTGYVQTGSGNKVSKRIYTNWAINIPGAWSWKWWQCCGHLMKEELQMHCFCARARLQRPNR